MINHLLTMQGYKICGSAASRQEAGHQPGQLVSREVVARVAQRGMTFGDSAEMYTLLSIGDGHHRLHAGAAQAQVVLQRQLRTREKEVAHAEARERVTPSGHR